MNRHLHIDHLTALLESNLDGVSTEPGNPHLVECPACRGRLRSIEGIRGRLVAHAASFQRSAELEERVMDRVFAREDQDMTSTGTIPGRSHNWSAAPRRHIMPAVAAVALVALVILGVGVIQSPSQAWTLEQSIAATRPMEGVYFEGKLDGHVGLRMWMRGTPNRPHVEDMLLRMDTGVTVSVRGNRTVYHVSGEPTAYVDDAQTAGMTVWPGAAFLDLLRRVSSAHEIDSRFDLLHMRKVTILRARLTDGEGPKSFEFEFDPRTKLLTRMVIWRNLQRSGVPAFSGSVRYYADMPDALFVDGLPHTLVYRERPVSVPNETVGLLAAGAGVLAADGAVEAASRQAVEGLYHAVVERDFARIRQLAPVTTLWSDTQVDAAFGGTGGQDMVTALVSVGEARRRGESSLGPLMVVPVVVRHRDGQLYDEKMIVQVRPDGDGVRCVVYGPYGRPYPSSGAEATR